LLRRWNVTALFLLNSNFLTSRVRLAYLNTRVPFSYASLTLTTHRRPSFLRFVIRWCSISALNLFAIRDPGRALVR
jgi:hypothetical protein